MSKTRAQSVTSTQDRPAAVAPDHAVAELLGFRLDALRRLARMTRAADRGADANLLDWIRDQVRRLGIVYGVHDLPQPIAGPAVQLQPERPRPPEDIAREEANAAARLRYLKKMRDQWSFEDQFPSDWADVLQAAGEPVGRMSDAGIFLEYAVAGRTAAEVTAAHDRAALAVQSADDLAALKRGIQ